MKKIRVTRGGCGICYTDSNGVKRHALKTPENGAFECSDEQADRLVLLGVAVYVEDVKQQDDTDTKQDGETESTMKAHLDAEELENWDYNELKKLAAELGVEPAGKKKADYIAAIVAGEVEVSVDDDELPPDLNVADPE